MDTQRQLVEQLVQEGKTLQEIRNILISEGYSTEGLESLVPSNISGIVEPDTGGRIVSETGRRGGINVRLVGILFGAVTILAIVAGAIYFFVTSGDGLNTPPDKDVVLLEIEEASDDSSLELEDGTQNDFVEEVNVADSFKVTTDAKFKVMEIVNGDEEATTVVEIVVGGTALLSWDESGVEQCQITVYRNVRYEDSGDNWAKDLASSGSLESDPIYYDQKYRLFCQAEDPGSFYRGVIEFTTVPSEDPVQPISISSSKLFSDSRFDFTFRYPDNWTLDIVGEDDNEQVLLIQPNTPGLGITLGYSSSWTSGDELASQTPQEYVDQKMTYYGAFKDRVAQKQIYLSGVPAHQRRNLFGEVLIASIYTIYGTKEFNIRYTYDEWTLQNEQALDFVTGSFKFTSS